MFCSQFPDHYTRILKPSRNRNEEIFDGAPSSSVDNGALFSEIGITELQHVSNIILPAKTGNYPRFPMKSHRPFSQYGSVTQSILSYLILGSIISSVEPDAGYLVNIRPILFHGSAQCLK